MSEMSGVDLAASELSYLLATLDASEIVGFDAAGLFPAKPSSREAIFKQGREELEAHGWMKPILDFPDEFELNAELLEWIAVIAVPSIVIATRRISAEQERQVVLHYLADESIVELSAVDEKTYRIGLVSDRSALFERIAEMLQCPGKSPSNHIMVDGEGFEKVQSLALKGQLEKARAGLESAGVTDKMADSILSAICDPAQGQIVLIRTHFGEVEAEQRVRVHGEGKQAWIVRQPTTDLEDVEMTTSDAGKLTDLLAESLDKLTN